jgi:glyoxylase-like metal-dependent hydrolase (beta-lactamase superfamily II)
VKGKTALLALVGALLVVGASACGSDRRAADTGASAPMSSHGYEVFRFVVGPQDGGYDDNTYLLVDSRSKQGLLIDPGGRSEELEAQVRAEGVRVVGILNTHGHYDHIGANAYYRKLYGVDVYASAGDLALYRNQAGVDPQNAPTKELPADGDLDVDGMRVRVIATPGHSEGSVCFLVEDMLFTGDTLFKGSVGRTNDELEARTLIASIEDRLLVLPPATLVFPGHGGATTIALEAESNPFLQGR